MTRTDSIRDELVLMIRRKPFHPFAIIMENGERAIVKHPENVAFDPEPNGRQRLFIISDPLVHHSTLPAVTSFAELDRGESSSE